MNRHNLAVLNVGSRPCWRWLACCLAAFAILSTGCDKAEELAEKTKKELEREVDSLRDKDKKDDTDKPAPTTSPTPNSTNSAGTFGNPDPATSITAGSNSTSDTAPTPASNGTVQPAFDIDPNADPAQVLREFGAKSSRQITDRDLAQLAALKSGKEQIKVLNLGDSSVSAAGIKYLEQLPYVVELSLKSLKWLNTQTLAPVIRQTNLVNLDLSHTSIGDADLAALAPLKNLRTLNLSGLAVTDAGLPYLGAFTMLDSLAIDLNRQLDGSGFAQLTPLKLRELSANSSSIGLKGLEHLKSHATLEVLNLGSASVSNATLEHLRECGNLRSLILDSNPIDSAGMVSLSRLRKLEYLSMRMTGISNSGLAHLKGCKQLKKLVVGNPTDVTLDGENALRRSIPQLQVEH